MKWIWCVILGIAFGAMGNPCMAQSDKPVVGLTATQNNVKLFEYSDFLNLKIENSTLKDLKLEIYNIIGGNQKLKIQEISKNKNYQIDTKQLATGYYLLFLKDTRTKFNRAYRFKKVPDEVSPKASEKSKSDKKRRGKEQKEK